jgi:hypothetical protein
MGTILPRKCRVLAAFLALGGWAAAAHAQPYGPVALVVNSDDPAFSWERVQRTMAEALGTAVVATDDPTARDRRGLLTVSWRPSRRELAVTYEDARGVIGRIVPVPEDVAAGVAAAAFLAVNLARDQAADILGSEEGRGETPQPPPDAPAAPPRRPRMVTEVEPPPAPPPPLRRWTISLAGGVGAGWATGSGDVTADEKVAPGLAPSGLMHLAPEVGYYLRPWLLLALSARLELIPGTTDRQLPMSDPAYRLECGGNFVCEAAHTALAGLARATFFGADATDDLRPFLSVALGVGQIRHTATFGSVAMCGPKGVDPCVDTITAGPIFAGPGVGLRYRLAPAFELLAGLEVLLGGPHFTMNADLNVGAAVTF